MKFLITKLMSLIMCLCLVLVASGCTKTITKIIEVDKIRVDTVFIVKAIPNKLGIADIYGNKNFIIENKSVIFYNKKNKKTRVIIKNIDSTFTDYFILKNEIMQINYYLDFSVKSIQYIKKLEEDFNNNIEHSRIAIGIENQYSTSGVLEKTITHSPKGTFQGQSYSQKAFKTNVYEVVEFYKNKKIKNKKKYCLLISQHDPSEEIPYGTWQYFSESGELIKEEFYQYGKLIKTKEYK